MPTGLDLPPVGVAGVLELNGVEYDACPLYQIGQFSLPDAPSGQIGQLSMTLNFLAVTGCTLELQQGWTPAGTKLQFDVWNEDEVKFTGAYECADSWHFTSFGDDIDAGHQNFQGSTLGTSAARYRVQASGARSAGRAARRRPSASSACS